MVLAFVMYFSICMLYIFPALQGSHGYLGGGDVGDMKPGIMLFAFVGAWERGPSPPPLRVLHNGCGTSPLGELVRRDPLVRSVVDAGFSTAATTPLDAGAAVGRASGVAERWDSVRHRGGWRWRSSPSKRPTSCGCDDGSSRAEACPREGWTRLVVLRKSRSGCWKRNDWSSTYG